MTDQEKGAAMLDGFIDKVNADHDDVICVSRNNACWMRDEIERLRHTVIALAATPICSNCERADREISRLQQQLHEAETDLREQAIETRRNAKGIHGS